MRMLIWHVDHFTCTITERGRSKFVEEYDDPVTAVSVALLVLASVEAGDEADAEGVAQRSAEEILQLCRQLKVDTVVLHPFAHLFGELGRPSAAIAMLTAVETQLTQELQRVIRTPFGWFNKLDIRAKGHPISRVARQITPRNEP